MNQLFAEVVLLQCNQALSQTRRQIDRLVEQNRAKTLLLERAEQDMLSWMRSCQRELNNLGQWLLTDDLAEPPSPGRAMEWEPSVPQL